MKSPVGVKIGRPSKRRTSADAPHLPVATPSPCVSLFAHRLAPSGGKGSETKARQCVRLGLCLRASVVNSLRALASLRLCVKFGPTPRAFITPYRTKSNHIALNQTISH